LLFAYDFADLIDERGVLAEETDAVDGVEFLLREHLIHAAELKCVRRDRRAQPKETQAVDRLARVPAEKRVRHAIVRVQPAEVDGLEAAKKFFAKRRITIRLDVGRVRQTLRRYAIQRSPQRASSQPESPSRCIERSLDYPVRGGNDTTNRRPTPSVTQEAQDA